MLVLVGVEPDVGVKEPIATARPGRAWGTSLVREVSVGGWLVTDVTRGVNKSEVFVVGGASAAGRLLVGFSMRARKMVSSAGVRAFGSNPVERLSLWLTGEVPCWGVYWAGWRIVLTTSARNCSSPVGGPGRPFWRTAAASA